MQAYVAGAYVAPDVALQLPTGSGKTLVGLLIAEWDGARIVTAWCTYARLAGGDGSPSPVGPAPGAPGPSPTPPTPIKPRRFYGSVEIDVNRPVKASDTILYSVVMELQRSQRKEISAAGLLLRRYRKIRPLQ